MSLEEKKCSARDCVSLNKRQAHLSLPASTFCRSSLLFSADLLLPSAEISNLTPTCRMLLIFRSKKADTSENLGLQDPRRTRAARASLPAVHLPIEHSHASNLPASTVLQLEAMQKQPQPPAKQSDRLCFSSRFFCGLLASAQRHVQAAGSVLRDSHPFFQPPFKSDTCQPDPLTHGLAMRGWAA